MGNNSEHFPDNPKRGETVTILVNSSEIPQIGEDRVIPFKATGLRNRMWEISENQPATKQTLGKCANINYNGERNLEDPWGRFGGINTGGNN